MWIIAINGEEPITAQYTIDEIQSHKTWSGKSKVKISLCVRKIYQRIDIEYIQSIFDQFRHVVSYIEVSLPGNPITAKNIGESLKDPHKQFW